MENFEERIAFIGFNRQQTIANFKTFIEANEEIIKDYDRSLHFCRLYDNSRIDCIFPSKNYKGIQYDQIILSDDSRMSVKLILDKFNLEISNKIPAEFLYIEDIVE